VIHQTPLEKLPANFRIPEQDRNRFWYDEAKRCLVYDGAMFKRTFDRLQGLSDEYAYERAVERLFQMSVPEPPPTWRRRKMMALAAAGGVLVVGLVVLLGILLHHV
jgi:hypothetical protein